MRGKLSTSPAVLEVLQTAEEELTLLRTQRSRAPDDQLDADCSLRDSYEQILRCSFALPEAEKSRNFMLRTEKNENAEVEDQLQDLRRLVISCGLPKTDFYCYVCDYDSGSAPSLRACVWKILLGALVVDVSTYTSLMKLGPCSADKKIRDDTFRTYKNNSIFWSAVSEAQLTRVLTATARVLTAPKGCKNNSGNVGYVQGMNVLLAPLLFVMPTEVDAFACFSSLLAKHCPRYILANLEGVHTGCALAETCLRALDPELHAHLAKIFSSQLHMEIFMFQYVLTLFANMSELDQVLIVWDALFAFGVHFNCVLVATHIILQRKMLLQNNNAFRVQRDILEAPLDGELLVTCAKRLLCYIPPDLRNDLLLHPVEPFTSSKIRSNAPPTVGTIRKSLSATNLSNVHAHASANTTLDAKAESRIRYLSASKISSVSKNLDNRKDRRPASAPRVLSTTSAESRGKLTSSITASRILNPDLRKLWNSCGEGLASKEYGNITVTRSQGTQKRPKSAPTVRSNKSEHLSPRYDSPSNNNKYSRRTSEVDLEARPGWVRSLRPSTTSTGRKGKMGEHSKDSAKLVHQKAGNSSRISVRGDDFAVRRNTKECSYPHPSFPQKNSSKSKESANNRVGKGRYVSGVNSKLNLTSKKKETAQAHCVWK